MAGGLTISTLNDSSGVLATQNGMSGIAKAWVNLNGTGTASIVSSFNVSSITDLGTGQYQINFTTVMPNANYATVVTGREDYSGNVTSGATGQLKRTAQTTSYVIASFGAGSTPFDPVTLNAVVYCTN